MYNGYKANFVLLEKGYFLRIDPAKKIVRNDTCMNIIDKIYSGNKDKGKEEKRQLVRSALVDKVVMSSYGKTRYYRITDILFSELSSVKLENDMSLLNYYLTKYNLDIVNKRQPLLIT